MVMNADQLISDVKHVSAVTGSCNHTDLEQSRQLAVSVVHIVSTVLT